MASSGQLKGNMSVSMKKELQTNPKIARKKNARMLHGAVSAVNIGLAPSQGAPSYLQGKPDPHARAPQSRNKDATTKAVDDDAGSHRTMRLRMKLNQTNQTNQSGGLLQNPSGADLFERLNHTNPEIAGHRVDHHASY